jgi:hypothetical protein
MKKILLIISFITFCGIIAKCQLSEKDVFFNSDNVECFENDSPENWISIKQFANNKFIVHEYRNFGEKGRINWSAKDYFREIDLTNNDSIFYITTVYEKKCGYHTNIWKDTLKILETKSDSLYNIKCYNKNELLLYEGISKSTYPFIWEGELIDYYSNGQKKFKRNYNNNREISKLYYDKDGLLIDNIVEFCELEQEPILEGPTSNLENNIKYFFSQNVNYPSEAKEACIDGRVFASFIISDCGKIECIEIVISRHPLIDDAFIECIEKLPTMQPGRLNGKPVSTRLIVNILFDVY